MSITLMIDQYEDKYLERYFFQQTENDAIWEAVEDFQTNEEIIKFLELHNFSHDKIAHYLF